MHDLVIANGLIVDGTGAPSFQGDIAISGGLIAAIGVDLGAAVERIDAEGLIVTPGFVDVHTHYDGQAIWDSTLSPLNWHGVSTAVIGNCGVGFAPARPDHHERLIDLMAGVEDIPRDALLAGITWDWETYPEYLDALAKRPRTLDLAGMIPHGAIRHYVMGERANEAPSAGEIAGMAAIVRDAIKAGAVGLSSSRTILHTANDGTPLPGTFASEAELTALACAVREGGGDRGILEISPPGIAFPEPPDLLEEVEMMIRIGRASGCPIVFSLVQSLHDPSAYRRVLDRIGLALDQGVEIYAEVGTRPISVLLGFQGHFNPFAGLPSYVAIRDLPTPQRLAALREPDLRARLVSEVNETPSGLDLVFTAEGFWTQVFVTGKTLGYYPSDENSVAAIAARSELDPRAVAYDAMLENEGRGFLIYAINNWAERNRDALHTMITHRATIIGLGDAGAHITSIADASASTTLLTDWVRDLAADDPYHISLEEAVYRLSRRNAETFGLFDRGALKPGMKADINLIDLNALRAHMPVMLEDLPLGRPRLEQRADGYVAVFVNGQRVLRDGELTGALPGGVAGRVSVGER